MIVAPRTSQCQSQHSAADGIDRVFNRQMDVVFFRVAETTGQRNEARRHGQAPRPLFVPYIARDQVSGNLSLQELVKRQVVVE